MSLTLCDDGTLDTVFECDVCGEEIRYTGGDECSPERDEDGALTQDALDAAESEHECEGMPLQGFIDAHREEIRAGILRAVPNIGDLDDEALADWIANDEGLYNWAQEEGYAV